MTALTALTSLGRPVASAIDEVRAATALLTRIPTGGAQATAGAAAFGIVGAAVGAGGAVALVAVAGVSPLAAGALAVATMAVLSGGLHLDGLADTADALAVGDPARAEAARRDPRLGSAAVVALASVILVDAALLASLVGTFGVLRAGLACVVAAAGSRALAAASGALARGRLNSEGSGARFAAITTNSASVVALGSSAALAAILAVLVASPALLVGLVGGLGVAVIAAELLIRRRGALDGDGIGAVVEIAFAAILLVTSFAIGRL